MDANEVAYKQYQTKPLFDFGRAFSSAFTGLGKAWWPALKLAFVLSLVATILTFAATIAFGGEVFETDDFGDEVLTDFVVGLLLFFGGFALFLYHTACLDMAYRSLIGHQTELRDTVRRSLGYVAPLLLVTLLFLVGYIVGLLVFIIPGLIIAVGWAIAGPAYMFENVGIIESLKRSWQLTSGYKWMVFFVQLLFGFILQIVVYMAAIVGVIMIGLGLALFDGESALSQFLLNGGIIFMMIFSMMIYMGFFASMTSAIYAECVGLQDRWVEAASEPQQA